MSYLLITHDVDVIRAMAHHVMVLKDGDIVETGTVAQVLDHPRAPLHPHAGGRRLLKTVFFAAIAATGKG